MFSTLLNFLNQHVTITPGDFKMLMSKLEECNFKKKQPLTEIGEVENYLYFVEKGLIRRFFYKGKEEIVAHIAREGGMAGSASSFFFRQPSRYRVEALEPTRTLRLSRENIDEFFRLDNKWEKIGRLITGHFLIRQELLILDGLRLTVRERFIKFMHENPDLIQRVPQKQLASYLNIKQETFSRLKHMMVEKQKQH